jgi:hypothetical protein
MLSIVLTCVIAGGDAFLEAMRFIGEAPLLSS